MALFFYFPLSVSLQCVAVAARGLEEQELPCPDTQQRVITTVRETECKVRSDRCDIISSSHKSMLCFY